jgi:DNA-binding beta-propeller fold protein YncE
MAAGAQGAGLIYNRGLSAVNIGGNVGEGLHRVEVQSAEIGRRLGIHGTVRPAASLGRAAFAAGLAASLAMMAGCGNTYRPVESAIGVVGPAGQPTKYAVAVSSPSATSNGLVTMVDFSGDTVVVTAELGVDPYYLALNASGTTGYTLNSDKTMNTFDLSPSLISSQVLQSTLLAGATPVSLYATSNSTYIPDPGVNAIDQLLGTPPALKQELPIACLSPADCYTPVYVVGQSGASRIYGVSQSTSGGAGQVEAIENASSNTSSPTISTTLPVGRGPVYGVMSVDDRRAFILNQTDGTVTVINAQTNALDTPVTTIPVGVRPVWADLASALNELVVVNEGTGTSNGSVTLVNIPMCTASALPANPNCDATNPIDATTFGQIVATIPVGVNPIMVSVLSDYTRAYVANAGDPSLPCGTGATGTGTTPCSVSVVDLTHNKVTATIPINGHPAWIATADSTPTGKVYVVCKDSQVMTVIETDTDTLYTTIPLQGYGVSVRMTSP